MLDNEICSPTNKRTPWNKGKLIGARPPLRPKHVWSISGVLNSPLQHHPHRFVMDCRIDSAIYESSVRAKCSR
jgi:hypothetical protein